MVNIICGDGMCPYVPCKDYPECNHIKKIINYSHDWEGKFKKRVFQILRKKMAADNKKADRGDV